jgi:hypothetical protein
MRVTCISQHINITCKNMPLKHSHRIVSVKMNT